MQVGTVILSTSKIRPHVSPRTRLFGLVRAWAPSTKGAIELAVGIPAPTTARAVTAKGIVVDRAKAMSVPTVETANAISHLLGTFEWKGVAPLVPPISGTRPSSGIGVQNEIHRSDRDSCEERLAAILQPALDALFDTTGPLEWPHPFHEYQRDGIQVLLERNELLLADDMGLGKTIQAVAAMRLLFFRGEIKRALVVCPAGLITQWQREMRLWAPELLVVPVNGTAPERAWRWRLPAQVNLVSYETVRSDVMDLSESPVLAAPWDVLVLDEASRIKNSETSTSRACKRIPAQRKWALTGTPLENSIEDLVSLLTFLCGSDRLRGDTRSVAELLAEVQLRRKKEDVLPDLPPKTVVEIDLELLPRQAESYQSAETAGVLDLRERGERVQITHVLELITRLKQICNRDPGSNESAKLDDISYRMSTLTQEGHRALLFSQFTSKDYGIGFAEERLRSHNPLTYSGEMSADARSRAVDTFERDQSYKVFALSLRAGGVGLNLQSASYVFHLDRWWNPAIEDQAESRSHRMGQPYPVMVYKYTCLGTIEERIRNTLAAKRELFREFVDDVSIDLTRSLSEAELFGLFDLPAPRFVPESGAADEMSGEEFEAWVAKVLAGSGFAVTVTPKSRDGGLDLIATKFDPLGIETRLLIQCKNWSKPAGVSVIRELRGVVPDRQPGVSAILICSGGFTADAATFARANGVVLWTSEDLKSLDFTDHQETTP